MEDNSEPKHYIPEMGIKLPVIQKRKIYYPPFSSENPKPMKKHVDVTISVWERLNRFKYQNRCRTLSQAIGLALKLAEDSRRF